MQLRGTQAGVNQPSPAGDAGTGQEAPPLAASASPADVPAPPAAATWPAVEFFRRDPAGAGGVTCPYCWHRFDPEDALFVATHPDLMGDPVLGPEEPLRFLPSRFTPDGTALDVGGMVCSDRACPRCHLRVPPALVRKPPFFLSVVGAPGSGKSYFLTSLVWKTRALLPEQFGLRFLDSDTRLNAWFNAYEEKIFLAPPSAGPQVIEKTHMQGDHYLQVMLSGMAVRLPKPSLFSVEPQGKTMPAGTRPLARTLVLYDNAGEHFLPEGDRSSDPGTQHVLHAEGIFFLLDPTQDPRLCRLIRQPLLETPAAQVTQSQHNLLLVMLDLVKRYGGQLENGSVTPPVFVVLAKADLLTDSLPRSFGQPPLRPAHGESGPSLDVGVVMDMSFFVRDLLRQHAPEIVSTVETVASTVYYLPNSALGHSPRPVAEHPGTLAVRPADVKPLWPEVPLLLLLHHLGCLAGAATPEPGVPYPEKFAFDGSHWVFALPGSNERVRIPRVYSGCVLTQPRTGVRFRVPQELAQQG